MMNRVTHGSSDPTSKRVRRTAFTRGGRALLATAMVATLVGEVAPGSAAGESIGAPQLCQGESVPNPSGALTGDIVAYVIGQGTVPLPEMEPLNAQHLVQVLKNVNPALLPQTDAPPQRPPQNWGPRVCVPTGGTYTQDIGMPTRVSQRDGVPVVEITINSHWTNGIGAGGRAVASMDATFDEKGDLAAAGREQFEGTFAGQSGATTAWTAGNIAPNGTFTGHARSIASFAGMEGAHFDANYFGTLGVGGHWRNATLCFDKGTAGARELAQREGSFSKE